MCGVLRSEGPVGGVAVAEGELAQVAAAAKSVWDGRTVATAQVANDDVVPARRAQLQRCRTLQRVMLQRQTLHPLQLLLVPKEFQWSKCESQC